LILLFFLVAFPPNVVYRNWRQRQASKASAAINKKTSEISRQLPSRYLMAPHNARPLRSSAQTGDQGPGQRPGSLDDAIFESPSAGKLREHSRPSLQLQSAPESVVLIDDEKKKQPASEL